MAKRAKGQDRLCVQKVKPLCRHGPPFATVSVWTAGCTRWLRCNVQFWVSFGSLKPLAFQTAEFVYMAVRLPAFGRSGGPQLFVINSYGKHGCCK